MLTWELRLFDATGARVATFTEWPELNVEIRVNSGCTWALRLDGDDPRVALFEEGGLIEGWWCSPEDGIAWHREFCGFIIDEEAYEDAGGAAQYVASGYGIEFWLSATIIDVAAGSAASRQNAAGETAIKNWVDEHAGPGAGARAREDLIIEADHAPALGAIWTGQRSNRNLLETVIEMAEATGVQWWIERTGAYEFEFRITEATDRRATVIFATERQNMGQPRLVTRRSKSVTRVKVGGAGEGEARAVEYVEDATAIAASPIGRREAFQDARDQTETDEYIARGQKVLDENRATVTLDFNVLQSPGCLYGKHYFLGNLVTARYGRDYDRRIDRVKWRVTGAGATPAVTTIAVAEEGS